MMNSTQDSKPTGAKSVKTKKVASVKVHVHPKYSEMISDAIRELKSRTGCSRPAILKFIREKYDIGDEKKATTNLRLALKRGIENGTLKMSRMEGKNSHKFKLGDNATVKKSKKINLGAKEKKPKKIAKKASKGKTAGVKKAAKLNKGKSKVAKKATTTKKPTSKLTKTSKGKSGAKGAKKVAKKTVGLSAWLRSDRRGLRVGIEKIVM